jgi:hypothetical protein
LALCYAHPDQNGEGGFTYEVMRSVWDSTIEFQTREDGKAECIDDGIADGNWLDRRTDCLPRT